MKYLVKEDRSILGSWYPTFFVVFLTFSYSNSYGYDRKQENKSSTYSQSSKQLLEKIIQITFKFVVYQMGMIGSVGIRSTKYLTLDSLKMPKVFL